MNVVAILGSPRRGNSAAITERFLAAAENVGANTRSFSLNDLSFQGCQACFACKTDRDRCIVADDLTPVLEAVQEADVVVLATPVYFGDITSQLKTFFDRMFSFFTPDFKTSKNPSRLAPGKKLIFIQTQGNPDETSFSDIFPRYDRFFRRFGFAETHRILAAGLVGPGDALKTESILKETERMAARGVVRSVS